MSKRLPYPYVKDASAKRRYWKSLRERNDSPSLEAAMTREFAPGVADPPDGVSRRDFFRLMGASAALAGVAACRRPDERILPYSRQPEEVVPGVPLYFATAMPWNGTAIGLVVESHEGRPTKIEGNPKHPESLGSVNSWAQASVLNLWDPDRSGEPTENGEPRSWEAASTVLAALGKKFAGTGGKGLAILTEGHRSPTTAAALARLKAALPSVSVFRYESFSKQNSRDGAKLAFGRPLEIVHDIDRAKVVVALDSDFLMDDNVGGVRHAKGFAKGRNAGAGMSRLYSVESTRSVTGAMADHRLRLQSHEVANFALTLARECGVSSIGQTRPLSPEAEKFFKAVAHDLDKNRQACTIVVGDRQAPAVHAAVHLANVLLGGTSRFVQAFDDASDGPESIRDLAKAIGDGSVKSLVILGGNPVWNAPADANLGNLLAKLEDSLHLSEEKNETSAMCKWHLNRAHFLEAWGDVRALDGTVSIVQPLIAPLYDGKTDAEVVELLSGGNHNAYDLVRMTALAGYAGAPAGAGFESTWRHALHDGTWPQTAYAAAVVEGRPAGDVAGAAAQVAAHPLAGMEVTFVPDPHAYDGAYANNGWMQEHPDPMTKLTWGNVALVSPADAKRLGVEDEGLVTISLQGGAQKTLPVIVLPGQAEGSICVPIGQGRKIVGRVGEGIGVATTHFRTTGAFGYAGGAKVEAAAGSAELSRTQEHYEMEGREPVREVTLAQLAAKPDVVKEMQEEFPREKNGLPLNLSGAEIDYSKGHKWAMTIDLNTCIGCGGCTVACIAENNIPVVGADGVRRSREMHWIRVDRYYEGSEESPRSMTQPMTCQQCENAPCEEVCPVGATTHSPEGLNDMAYNRCIGTKYCLNNCPFKVRHFNYFNYAKNLPDLRKAQFNPDVTVRSRGVMEKCTYCVQRINFAKIDGHKQGTDKIADGTIKTACQQACPTDAITFGDLNDPTAKVTKLKNEPRSYVLLEELNVRPRTTYLARLRNPNPELG
jgi:molybdopterin-containing oxidoreductase family iron-sulfur binding subunit